MPTHTLIPASSTGSTKKTHLSIAKLIKNIQTGTAASISTFQRPDFSTTKKEAARLEAVLATGYTGYADANLTNEDLAAPHRAPYARIRNTILEGTKEKVTSMVQTLSTASEHYEKAFSKITGDTDKSRYHSLGLYYLNTRMDVNNALKDYQDALSEKDKNVSKLRLLQAVNNLASNAPGLGPHSTANAIVSDRLHVHPTDEPSEPMTPRSRAALAAFPLDSVATAYNPYLAHDQIVSVTGAGHTLALAHPTENINAGNRVVRGALYVSEAGEVYRPKNPFQHPTGNFSNDWELVT